MRLWTIQKERVYETLQETGVYHCDADKLPVPEMKPFYDWLVEEMKLKIGDPPDRVQYPIWAWYKRDGQFKKPDLRAERWHNGWKGDRYVCLEIDIPEDRLVLTDFDTWSLILLDAMISDTEEEDRTLWREYSSLSPTDQIHMKRNNWNRVFDLTPLNNNWIRRGHSIQASFWELKKENMVNARFFTSALPKCD